jgi:hypothetical protein
MHAVKRWRIQIVNSIRLEMKSVIITFADLMERWLSGRKRQIANLLYGLDRTEGSNPSLSVLNLKFRRRSGYPLRLFFIGFMI